MNHHLIRQGDEYGHHDDGREAALKLTKCCVYRVRQQSAELLLQMTLPSAACSDMVGM